MTLILDGVQAIAEVEADGLNGAIDPSRFNYRVHSIFPMLLPSNVACSTPGGIARIFWPVLTWSWDKRSAVLTALELPSLISSRSL